jgi:RecG-like helicase
VSNLANQLISDELIEAMEKKGVHDRIGLVFHFPKKFKDFRKRDTSLADVLTQSGVGSDVYLRVKLMSSPNFKTGSGKRPTMVLANVSDGIRTFPIARFGNAFVWRRLKAGDYIHISGKIFMDDFNGVHSVKNPDLVPADMQGKIAPIYSPRGKDFNSEQVYTAVTVALEILLKQAEQRVCEAVGLTSPDIACAVTDDFRNVSEILKAMHSPVSIAQLDAARRSVRMINALHVIIQIKESHHRSPHERASISYAVDEIKQVLKNVPFTITDEQKRCVWNVTQQLASREPMDHLIYGDVGCGKTVSYAIPSILAQHHGKQVVILTPNSLLAKQVTKDIKEYGPETPSHLVIRGVKKKELDKIDLKERPIIVGTSAVFKFLTNNPNFDGVDLLICDEQQKLGTSQKEILTHPFTNIIEATATPVPRTVAHSLYADKAVSFIEKAPVKKDIKTVIVPPSSKRKAFELMKSFIESGDQVAVVCPNRVQLYTWFDAQITSEDDEDILLSNLKQAGLSKIEIQKKTGTNYRVRCRQRITNIFETKEEADENIEGVKVTKWEEVQGAENALESKRNVIAVGELWNEMYPGRVVTIHGGMTPDEKLACMDQAMQDDCAVIVTSSLIEVGLTFPRLRALLIQASEMMGISTLHQLRGRLARHGGDGLFMMGIKTELEDTPEKTIERLEALVHETRGSKLAEIDMYQRGVGDLRKSGVIQSGNVKGLFPDLKILPSDLTEFMARTEFLKRKSEGPILS